MKQRIVAIVPAFRPTGNPVLEGEKPPKSLFEKQHDVCIGKADEVLRKSQKTMNEAYAQHPKKVRERVADTKTITREVWDENKIPYSKVLT